MGQATIAPDPAVPELEFYRGRLSTLNRPAWSESQNPFTGRRPVTIELTSRIFLGASVITWSTLWSKSLSLPATGDRQHGRHSGSSPADCSCFARLSRRAAAPHKRAPSPGLTSVFLSEFRSPTRTTGSLPVAGPPGAISSLACASRIAPLPTSAPVLVWLATLVVERLQVSVDEPELRRCRRS